MVEGEIVLGCIELPHKQFFRFFENQYSLFLISFGFNSPSLVALHASVDTPLLYDGVVH